MPKNDTARTFDIDIAIARDMGVRAASIEQYLGVWAVDSARFMSVLNAVSMKDLSSHIAATQRSAVDVSAADVSVIGNQKTGRVAVINIGGTLTKMGSSVSDAGSMLRIRREIRAAVVDERIGALVLRIDSPGGTVAGTSDLAADVRAAAAVMPVTAFVEDLAASAAFWVASQASKIVANNDTALVGSIGTFVGLHDMSSAAGQQGIEAVVIRSGRFKGAGFPGTKITDEQREMFQAVVDKTQEQFTAAVSLGRGLSVDRVSQLADGRVHLAQDALGMGLIDSVESFDAVVRDIQGSIKTTGGNVRRAQSQPKELNAMADDTKITKDHEDDVKAPAAASYGQIVAGCPGADPAFICEQLAAAATVESAQRAWMTTQQLRIETRDLELKQKEEAATAAATRPGVAPILDGAAAKTDTSSDPISAWNNAVNANVAAGMSRDRAVAACVRDNPSLHAEYLEAYNETHRARVA